MRALLLSLVLLTAGCVTVAPGAQEDVAPQSLPDAPSSLVTIHTANGLLSPEALAGTPLTVPRVLAHATGHQGAEPTMGVTSDGTLFFVAFEKVLRSTDHGESWEVVHEFPTTLDPMLWVDPLTDRVFVDHLYVGCSYLAWSDDLGETWTHNPAACGVPVNDHQKVATAPPKEGALLQPTAAYPNLVLYAYNAIAAGSRISISLDGGVTFPINREFVAADEPYSCSGGLHGHPTAAPNGTIYIPKRSCDGVLVAASYDSGLTWTQQLAGGDVGSTTCRKNPEVATDAESNAYVVWPAADQELYLSTTTNEGRTWSESVRVSPPEMEVTTMPVAAAGSAGRLAVAYYGIEKTETVNEVPDRVNESGRWHLYLAQTHNALDPEPQWVTVQVTPDDDPIQIGPISTNSGCDNPPGSRNLLDFIDMVMDEEGRVYVAYADGCTQDCAGNPDATMEDSRDRAGYVAVATSGMSLLADVDLLADLTGASRGHTS